MLQIAANWLEQEATDVAAAKEAYMEENCPTPDLSGDMAALAVTGLNPGGMKNLGNFQPNVNVLRWQDYCKKLYQSLDKIDEDRYDAEAKVEKTQKEVERLANWLTS